ncbi:PAS domain S-box protein [Actinoplanes sp. KI2]|uniref:PAS domain-containing hybrid sensor histidine kinase/response regulator n=1 Tax=Actinoplanes sp. KI2 TaxID=2983315 RepID=UPI0021D5F8FF|nr:PAS domain-containing hybrid sensor histidine kinase/response regulator [Actinoplanes sp. KI2]MCU7729774.1 PAS domain S-box protein [Actinoplanes sp. KI2]
MATGSAIAIGLLVLAGHPLRSVTLVAIVPGWTPTTWATAVLAIGAGSALWLLAPPSAGPTRRVAGRVLAGFVLVGTLLILFRRGTALSLPFLSITDGSSAAFGYVMHGRPPVRSAMALLMIGLSLLTLDLDARHGHRPAQLLGAAAPLLAGVTTAAAAIGEVSAVPEAKISPMPAPAVLILVGLGVGVVTARPRGLTVQVFGSPYVGGRTVRRLIPGLFAVVVLIGGVMSFIGRTKRPIDGLIVVTAVTGMLVCLYWLLLSAGNLLNEADAQQHALIDELRDQREFSDTVLSSLVEGVVTVAPDRTILSVSPPWCQMTGYSADEIIGLKPPYPWWPSGEITEWREVQLAAFTAGTVTEFEADIRRRDGTRMPCLITARHVQAVGERGRILVATYRDVTERNRNEADRRRMARQLDHFFTMSRDLMCISSGDGYFVRANPAWEHTLGYSIDELVGRRFIEFIHPDDHQSTIAVAARLAAGQSLSVGFDNRYRTRDGGYRWLSWTASPADEEGTIYAVARDVTERKKADEALASARDEALAAAQLKSQFVAMVSHEIRTPMNGVIGLTALLLDTPLDAAQRRYGEAIRSSARALLTIINEILDFSKIEAGKLTLTISDIDLGNLIEEVAQAASAAVGNKDLEVIASYPPGLPARVHGDEGRIRQVLLNLAGNAVKFTRNGHVIIRLDTAADDGDRFTFAVTDTGIGIDQARISHMFEPFTQADASTSREFGGTGLGLAISRQLVELMGGHLEAESALGRGSRFHFTINLTVPAGSELPPPPDTLTGRLLLVAPQPATRQFLTEHLHHWGLITTTVTTAQQALAELARTAADGPGFDLAVIDDLPPELDGAALLTAITSDPALPQPACLLLTRDPASVRSHDIAGRTAVLAKPVGSATLYHGLAAQLRPADEDVRPASPATRATPRKRVLLAEDNEINQLVAVGTLNAFGYDADIARNGVEAVELASSHEYEAILMDCQMPKLDGYQATTQLRNQEPAGRHIPIIALTAGALHEDRRRARQAGMDDFLAKPLNPDELRVTLERWTSHEPSAG